MMNCTTWQASINLHSPLITIFFQGRSCQAAHTLSAEVLGTVELEQEEVEQAAESC